MAVEVRMRSLLHISKLLGSRFREFYVRILLVDWYKASLKLRV